MLRGSGDFVPNDPLECPESCPYYTPEREPDDYCQYPAYKGVCYYEEED